LSVGSFLFIPFKAIPVILYDLSGKTAELDPRILISKKLLSHPHQKRIATDYYLRCSMYSLWSRSQAVMASWSNHECIFRL